MIDAVPVFFIRRDESIDLVTVVGVAMLSVMEV